MERRVKHNGTVDAVPTDSCIVGPEAGSQVKFLWSAKKKFCFIRDTSFKKLEDERELEIGPFQTEKECLILVGPPYCTRGERSQWSSAHDVFSK